MSDVHTILKTVSFAEPFVKALETLGSPQIRNLATIGKSKFWFKISPLDAKILVLIKASQSNVNQFS